MNGSSVMATIRCRSQSVSTMVSGGFFLLLTVQDSFSISGTLRGHGSLPRERACPLFEQMGWLLFWTKRSHYCPMENCPSMQLQRKQSSSN